MLYTPEQIYEMMKLSQATPNHIYNVTDGSRYKGGYHGDLILQVVPLGRHYSNVILNRFIAGETLGGHRVVEIIGGKVYYYNPSIESNIGKEVGVTNQAAEKNELIEVVLSGVVVNNGWNLTPDAIYYLGANGTLTTSVATSGIDQRIGVAIDSNTLKLELSEPCELV